MAALGADGAVLADVTLWDGVGPPALSGGPSVVVPAHIVDGRKQLRPFEKGARAKVPRWTFRVGFRNGIEWDNPLVTT